MEEIKLSKKQVKQYEKLSGFKTTDDVTFVFSDHEVMKLAEDLLLVKEK